MTAHASEKCLKPFAQMINEFWNAHPELYLSIKNVDFS